MNNTCATSRILLSTILSLGLAAVSSAEPLSPLTVFTSDFNAGAPHEFSGVTTTESTHNYAGLGTGTNVFSGDFLRNASGGTPEGASGATTIMTLTGLPPHSSINLNFLLAIIDSWDGETCCHDPDIFNVVIDGKTIFSESLTNIASEHFASYPGPMTPANVVLAKEKDLGFSVGGYYLDSAYNMALDPKFQNIPHTSSTLTIKWFASGAGWQGGSDESWGIDNVEVQISNTVEKVFSDLTARAEITLGPKSNDDSYWVRGWLKLADTSNGIDPLTEAVTIKVGPFSHTLPAGSFLQDGSAYFFKGPVGPSTLDVRITPSSTIGGYSFKSCLKGGSLGATTMEPQVQLTIGDDQGQITLDVGHAKFGKGNKDKNWVFSPVSGGGARNLGELSSQRLFGRSFQ